MERHPIRNRDKQAVGLAKHLRREMPKAERLLWKALRLKSTGFRFRRQHPVGDYILDFFCWEAMLCVEVDGLSHETRGLRDKFRDDRLANLGIETLRFSSHDVFENVDGVWQMIQRRCQERTSPS